MLLTENDFIFSVSNTRDNEGTVTKLLHVDFVNRNEYFDFPLSESNARVLRKAFNNLDIEEYNER